MKEIKILSVEIDGNIYDLRQAKAIEHEHTSDKIEYERTEKFSMDKKMCCTCKEYKPLDKFYIDRSHPSGHCAKCKKCAAKYSKEHHIKQKRIREKLKNMPKEKTCSLCKETKPMTEFYRAKSSKDLHTNWCKDCTCKKHREYLAMIRGTQPEPIKQE
jgi:uncharacterized protein (DUF39 family)